MTGPVLDEDGLCVCCQLDPRSCGKAAARRQQTEEERERRTLLARPGATAAAFPGVCGDCGEPFPAGTPIQARAELGHRRPIDRRSTSSWRSLLCCGGD